MRPSTLESARAAALAESRDPAAWLPVIAEIPLFAGLSDRQLQRIARLGTVERRPAQTDVVTVGGVGDAAYVVLDGRCEVIRGRSRRTVEVGPGSLIGEMALFDGAPRSATVRTLTDTTLLRLDRKQFLRIIRDAPSTMQRLLETLATRVREAESDAIPA